MDSSPLPRERVTNRGLTIALFRARSDSERSAARLDELGLESVIAPVAQVRATRAGPPSGEFDAVVATSAKAFELMSAAVREAIVGFPLFVVGEQGARAAAARGLQIAEAPAADAAALSRALRARLAAPSRIIYLAGRHRRSELEVAFCQAGHSVTPVEVYAAEARKAWAAAEAEAVSRCDAALHYSRRSAELSVRLAARAGIADCFRAILHVCLSEDVAAPLGESGGGRIVFAKSPQEGALFDALAGALPGGGTGDL
jgi:uroporphyrinogen-III synthase